MIIGLNTLSLLSNLKAQENYQNLDSIVAIVEKDVVTQKELDEEIYQTINRLKKSNITLPTSGVLNKQVLDSLIEKKLIMQFANNHGIKIENQFLEETINSIALQNKMTINELQESVERDGLSFRSFRGEINYQLILKQLKEREITSKINISDYEVEAFLKKNKDKNPLEYHLYHILIKKKPEDGTNAEVEKILSLLTKKTFDEIAMSHSDGPLADKGGDMGWKKLDELPSIFSDAIADMKVGDISKPITSENGIHLIKLTEIKGGDASQEKILSEQYNISQIVIKTNEITNEEDIIKKLENIRNQISAGLSFSDAATKYSEDASSSNGGNIGWVDINSMLPQFRVFAESSVKGQVTGPHKTELGWVLLLPNDKRQQDITNERMQMRAKFLLQQRKAEIKYIDWIQGLKDQANIEILLNN